MHPNEQRSSFAALRADAFTQAVRSQLQQFAQRFELSSLALIEHASQQAAEETTILSVYGQSTTEDLGCTAVVRVAEVLVFDEPTHCVESASSREPLDRSFMEHLALLASHLGNLIEHHIVTGELISLHDSINALDLARLFVHDHLNLLNALSRRVSSLIDDARPPGDLRLHKRLSDLPQMANRAQANVRGFSAALRHFDRQVAVREIIEQIEDFARFLRIDDILALELDPSAANYSVPSIAQMLLSTILKNAYDALQMRNLHKGDIHLRVRITHSGRTLEFICTDRGAGMDDSMKARLFRPFASTRGYGRGLGLYLAKRLVAGLEGSLDLQYSNPSLGTRFRLEVPCRPLENPRYRA